MNSVLVHVNMHSSSCLQIPMHIHPKHYTCIKYRYLVCAISRSTLHEVDKIIVEQVCVTRNAIFLKI